FVGDRFALYKQFDLAISVAKRTKKPLVVVGKPLVEVEKMKLKGVEYKVLSGVSSAVLNILYNNAFCLLYPSLYEGFGIPVIEAQKAGCPVIAGANSSISEVIGTGGIALDKLDVDNIIDAMTVLDRGKYRNEVINLGFENAKRFSWDKTYDQTNNIYKSLI
ncbi:glycosyltransferase, partial [Bacteroides caecimuris]